MKSQSEEWEDDLAGRPVVLLSMLEHYSYCPRQFALIYIEGEWAESVETLRGTAGHERVDEPTSGIEDGVRWERALPVWSRRYGLRGKADLVEFPGGVPFPVEYKHGSRGGMAHFAVQICAQATCLEEMFGIAIPRGAIYSLKAHKRKEVDIDDQLKQATLILIEKVRAALVAGITPPPTNDRRCDKCSLLELCAPDLLASENRGRIRRAAEDCFAAKEP